MAAFGVTVSKVKTETMCNSPLLTPAKCTPKRSSLCYLAGYISADWDFRSAELTRRIRRAWACLGRYKMNIYIYNHPSVPLWLKVHMLIAEVMEALLYGCVTWSASKADYHGLRKVHH